MSWSAEYGYIPELRHPDPQPASAGSGSGTVQIIQGAANPPTTPPPDPTQPAVYYPNGGGTLSQWDVPGQVWTVIIFLLALLASMFSAQAANPDFDDFEISQFDVAGNKVKAKSGMSLTNLVLYGVTNNNSARFNNGLSIATGQTLDWNGDTFLQRENPNTLAQRNGTIAQTNYIYNTWNNGGTDYERASLGWAGNIFTVGTEKGGAGVNRVLNLSGVASMTFSTLSVAKWQISGSGNFLASTDNANDIGAVAANRPRSVYIGTDLTVGNKLNLSKTITAAGTTGAQTINKTSGSVNFAAAAQSIVVTCSLVDANSVIMATVATDDATATSCKAIPAAGSFTLKLNAAATAETRVQFLITN